MARIKITEYKAKSILLPHLGLQYSGVHIDTSDKNWEKPLTTLSAKGAYVAKVDQGVKKRGKAGLVMLNLKKNEVKDAIIELQKKGFSSFLVERFVTHTQSDEHYLAFERTRKGIKVLFSMKGGIDIEDAARKGEIQASYIDSELMSKNNDDEIRHRLETINISFDLFKSMLDIFNTEHFAFMEINPFVVKSDANGIHVEMLDLAVEVDSAGAYFATSWNKDDFVQQKVTNSEELAVLKLSEKSPSSFKLEILNQDGSVWMLLSGGGASLVIADEYHNLNHGQLIGNYGEYSGAPNEDETYEYARQIISLLLRSKARRKALLIAGGVANFTDVSVTFRGIVRALREKTAQLKAQNIGIYVRRGGPQQEKGLKTMQSYCEEAGLAHVVAGPECSLTEIVKKTLKML